MREEGRSSSSSSRLRKAARKMILAAAKACGSFSRNESSLVDPIAFDRSSYNPNSNSASISGSSRDVSPKKPNDAYHEDVVSATEDFESPISTSTTLPSDKQKLCAICLEGLKYGSKSKRQAIFTAQCSHAFHFSCISSNVRHGSVTCPICRARWTHLPRGGHLPASDPALRILDDSIATFRVHRRSLLRPPHRLRLRLDSDSTLAVSLADRRPADLVLLATPNGPHLRLLKQCMALVAFSLRPLDRLAVLVSHSPRVFPLRRMTPCGRRAALQVVDRLFYSGHHAADSLQGLEKAASILRDAAGSDSSAAVLHLSDSPTAEFSPSLAFPVHRFHVGEYSDGLVMRDFGEFLAGMLGGGGGGGGGAVSDVQLRVRTREGTRVVRIGELCAGEERRVLFDGYAGGDLGGGHAFVEYSYREEDGGGDDDDEGLVRGESLVSVGDDDNKSRSSEAVIAGGRLSSSVESWDYHDPYMARRWAKHLHGYRL